jgi:hypothetical protein
MPRGALPVAHRRWAIVLQIFGGMGRNGVGLSWPGFDVHGNPATAARLDLANGLQYLGTDIALGVTLEDVLAQLFHGFTIFSLINRMTWVSAENHTGGKTGRGTDRGAPA